MTGDELGEQGHGSLPRAGTGDGLVQEDTVRWLVRDEAAVGGGNFFEAAGGVGRDQGRCMMPLGPSQS